MQPNTTVAIITATISAISVIVAIITFVINNLENNRREFIKTFDEIYKKTFSLRSDISDKLSTNNVSVEFHYEVDTVIQNKEIEATILDYLTEIENLSVIIMKRSIYSKITTFLVKKWRFPQAFNNFGYNKLFKNLASPELYKRLLGLYPYILHKRRETNNRALFSNYLKLISWIENEKLSLSEKTPTIYSGLRVSDIEYDESYFDEDICIFGKTIKTSYSEYRANQNYNKSDFTDYFSKRFKEINKKYKKDYNIILYNQQNVYEFAPKIKEHVICYNNEEILNKLNNKIRMKELLKNSSIPTIEYSIFTENELSLKNIRKIIKKGKFIVQRSHGGGGIGTYILDGNTFSKHKSDFGSGRFLVSKYLTNSISVNTHIFVSDTVNLVTPGSIQIIEQYDDQLVYRGADFVSYKEIPQEIREEIRLLSIKICNMLRENGYLGVAGLDFIIDSNDNVFCTEINPRFQASSVIVSKYLYDTQNNEYDTTYKKDKGTNSSFKRWFNKVKIYFSDCYNQIQEDISIYDINKHAFEGFVKSGLSYYDDINYSCYYYFNENNMSKNDIDCKLNLLRELAKQRKNTKESKGIIVESVSEDGYSDFSSNKLNEKSYLFRVIFANKITQISPDHTIWVNDNVKLINSPQNKLNLKIALVNQGVRISSGTLFKKAVFSGIDYFVCSHSLHINSPIDIGFCKLSPFEIKEKENGYFLYYYTKEISKIIIEDDLISDSDKGINKEINLSDILYLSTDRIRIKPIHGCDFKNNGMGCRFCDLPFSKTHYSIADITTALKFSKKLDFNHILIGGGTNLSYNSWGNIIEIARICSHILPGKPISVMSIPAPYNVMSKMKSVGIQEVAFNMEIFDDKIAENYMPGKRCYNKDVYLNALNKAVNTFGVGNVRCAFVVGLEKTESLLNGIEQLCKLNVIPCLSIYRCISNSVKSINPTNEYLEFIYTEANKIATSYSLYIGPKCPACQNNMLSI